MFKFYLASTSPRRRAILKKLGITYKLVKPGYKEKNLPKASPARLVKQHALEKALSSIREARDGVLISADTIVYFKKNVIGKPKNMTQARSILAELQGQWHEVYTGVALFRMDSGKAMKRRIFYDRTRVLLKKMTLKDIERYFKKINPLDKAGAYAIQSKQSDIIEKIKGSYSNVAGFPEEKFKKNLLSFMNNRQKTTPGT